MSTDVNSEGTSLDKTLATTGCHAGVWSFIRVNSIMSLKIRFTVEAFTTSLPITLERACIGLILYQLHNVHSGILL